MAQITLEPSEVFEHTHDTETTTGLVSGQAELRMAENLSGSVLIKK